MKTNHEIGQMLVSGALDDTKTIGRPARIFSRILELKNINNEEKENNSGFVPDFRVDLAPNGVNPRTNGWAPYVEWQNIHSSWNESRAAIFKTLVVKSPL